MRNSFQTVLLLLHILSQQLTDLSTGVTDYLPRSYPGQQWTAGMWWLSVKPSVQSSAWWGMIGMPEITDERPAEDDWRIYCTWTHPLNLDWLQDTVHPTSCCVRRTILSVHQCWDCPGCLIMIQLTGHTHGGVLCYLLFTVCLSPQTEVAQLCCTCNTSYKPMIYTGSVPRLLCAAHDLCVFVTGRPTQDLDFPLNFNSCWFVADF